MSDITTQELETKFAFLERHVEEQDRIIMKLQHTVDLLVKEVTRLKDNQTASGSDNDSNSEIDVKPPHY